MSYKTFFLMAALLMVGMPEAFSSTDFPIRRGDTTIKSQIPRPRPKTDGETDSSSSVQALPGETAEANIPVRVTCENLTTGEMYSYETLPGWPLLPPVGSGTWIVTLEQEGQAALTRVVFL